MLSLRPGKLWTPNPTNRNELAPRMRLAHDKAQDESLKNYYELTLPLIEQCEQLNLSEVELLALDLETTGLNPEMDDILSIGTVRMKFDRILYGSRRRWLLKPASKLRADSISIHGITHSEVESAPDLAQVLPEFLQEMAGRVAVVYCAAIEESFLDVAIRYRLGEGFVFPAIDTMGLARSFENKRKQNFLSKLFNNTQSHSLRLGDQRDLYGLPFYPPHEAVTDALATGELLMAMHQHHGLESERISDLLLCR